MSVEGDQQDDHALPLDLSQVAFHELGETTEVRMRVLSELQELLEKGGHLLHRQDAAYLLMYARWAKFDSKKALARLLAMEKWLEKNKALLGDTTALKAEDFRALYGVGFMKSVEGHTRDGAHVMMIMPLRLRPGDLPDPSILLKWNVWTLHRAVHDPYMQVSGQLIIETFQNMSFFQAMQFGKGTIPSPIMQQNMKFMSECAPYRLKGIWLFHQGLVVNILMTIVRPFLSKKMKERIRAFGTDMSALHELVDPSRLPAEFGGTSTDDGWKWFEDMKRTEEEARQGAADTSPSLA